MFGVQVGIVLSNNFRRCVLISLTILCSCLAISDSSAHENVQEAEEQVKCEAAYKKADYQTCNRLLLA